LFWELTEAAEAMETTKAYKHSDNFSLRSDTRAISSEIFGAA